MIPDCYTVDLCEKINIIQRAVMTQHTDTLAENCAILDLYDTGLEKRDSRVCNIGLTIDTNRDYLQWLASFLPKPKSETFAWSKLFEQSISPRAKLQVGLDPLEHPINLDREAVTAEFANFRSISSLVPKRFKNIGEYLR